MKIIGIITILLSGSIMIYSTLDFPEWGDPLSPANTHLSVYYIENSMPDTSVPNIVTAILADYRSYDTMFETTVIFAAGLACFLLLRNFRKKKKEYSLYRHIPTGVTLKIKNSADLADDTKLFQRIDSTWVPFDLVTRTASGLIVPFIQIFALYVIAHGHHSPGGGFQGGVIFGAAFILFAISYSLRESLKIISEKTAVILSCVGVMIYAGTGLLCLLFGSNFLNYGSLAQILFTDPVSARSLAILFVEIGVGLAVAGVMIWLYYNISSSGKYNQGL